MDFRKVIEKYNYSAELASFLTEVYNELVEYLGVDFEPIILESFLNTEIISCDNLYDCFEKRGLIENNDGCIATNSDLKRASGVYYVLPIIIYDNETRKYEIKDVERIVAISNLDLNQKYKKGIAVHELGHMAKGYYNEISIEGNILTIRCGLIESVYELSFDGRKVTKKLISEKGVGLEEGLNTVLENDISKKIVEPEYSQSGYKLIKTIVSDFLSNPDLRSAIINTEMLKDKKAFIKFFDEYYYTEGAYDTLERIVDKLYKLCLKQISEVFKPEKMQITTEEINSVILNEFNPFINKIVENRELARNIAKL